MTAVFENPAVPVITLVIAGAVLRTVGRRHERPKAVVASWVAYGLALGLVGLAQAVNTDREQIIEQTKAMLVSAEAAGSGGAANARARPLGDFFAAAVAVQGPQGAAWETTDAAGLADKLRQHRVRGTSLRRVEVNPPAGAAPGGADRATTHMRVSSRVGEGYPAPTTWEVGWVRTAGGWRIDRLRWLLLRDRPPTPALYN